MSSFDYEKFKKALDNDPDLVIRGYDQDEDVSILIIRSGDLGDAEYRVSLEIESIDEDGEENYTELMVRASTKEGIKEIVEGYLANGGSEESIVKALQE